MSDTSNIQTFKCPNCGAPVEYDGKGETTVRCTYCGTSAPVPAELLPQSTLKMSTQGLPDQAMALVQVAELLRAGNKIEAIKVYREHFGASLVDAKNAVEQIEQGRYVQVATSGSGPTVVSMNVSEPVAAVAIPAQSGASKSSGAGCVIGFILLFVAVAGAILAIVLTAASSFSPVMPDVPSIQQSMKATVLAQVPTRAPTPIPPSPTPSYANVVLSFGGEGIGAGKFKDARSVGVDGSGNIYVGEYSGGRIQVFDHTGKFVAQWFAGNARTLLLGFAVDHKGTVYVADGNTITRYEGHTGKSLGKLSYTSGPGFGELATTPDGGLIAMWYQRREGLFTSLDGAREDMVRFSPAGKVTQVISAVISSQTDELALDNYPAVDGQGNVYILSPRSGSIFKFGPDGKFVNRFGSSGNQPGQFQSPSAMSVDSQGRIYVADEDNVHIFGADGRHIKTFGLGQPASGMVFDDQDDLITVERTKVSQYVLGR